MSALHTFLHTFLHPSIHPYIHTSISVYVYQARKDAEYVRDHSRANGYGMDQAREGEVSYDFTPEPWILSFMSEVVAFLFVFLSRSIQRLSPCLSVCVRL